MVRFFHGCFLTRSVRAQDEKPIKTPEVEEDTEDIYHSPYYDLDVSTVTVGTNISEYEVWAEVQGRTSESLAEPVVIMIFILTCIFQLFEYEDFKNSSESSEQYEEYETYEDRYGPAERERAGTWDGQVGQTWVSWFAWEWFVVQQEKLGERLRV